MADRIDTRLNENIRGSSPAAEWNRILPQKAQRTQSERALLSAVFAPSAVKYFLIGTKLVTDPLRSPFGNCSVVGWYLMLLKPPCSKSDYERARKPDDD